MIDEESLSSPYHSPFHNAGSDVTTSQISLQIRWFNQLQQLFVRPGPADNKPQEGDIDQCTF